MKILKTIKDIIYNNPRADYQEPHMDDDLVKQLKKKMLYGTRIIDLEMNSIIKDGWGYRKTASGYLVRRDEPGEREQFRQSSNIKANQPTQTRRRFAPPIKRLKRKTFKEFMNAR